MPVGERQVKTVSIRYPDRWSEAKISFSRGKGDTFTNILGTSGAILATVPTVDLENAVKEIRKW